MTVHAGSCHCGAVTVRFDSNVPLAVRACQCSFCRKQGSRNVSDPDGTMDIESARTLTRYRFGLGVTDFLICQICGIYVAAVMRDGDGWRSTLNVNCLDDPHPDLDAEPATYDAEDAGHRLERRRQRWTPTKIVEPEQAGDANA